MTAPAAPRPEQLLLHAQRLRALAVRLVGDACPAAPHPV